MNAPTIITRVADLVLHPNSAMPSEWEHSTQKAEQNVQPQPKTSAVDLELSPLAQKILDESDTYSESEWEKVRSERVQRVQQLVQDKQYSMAPEVIDGIAHKIVAMLP